MARVRVCLHVFVACIVNHDASVQQRAGRRRPQLTCSLLLFVLLHIQSSGFCGSFVPPLSSPPGWFHQLLIILTWCRCWLDLRTCCPAALFIFSRCPSESLRVWRLCARYSPQSLNSIFICLLLICTSMCVKCVVKTSLLFL